MSQKHNDEIPSPTEFFLKTSLYKIFEINDENWEKVKNLITFDKHLDVYCTKEQIIRPFHPIHQKIKLLGKEAILANNNYHICFCSTVDKDSILEFHLIVRDKKLQKVGQYPSVADIEIAQIKKYNKLLKSQSRELSTAIGLNAHGVGIGSFVYLRRIIENLIEEAHQEALKNSSWEEIKYSNSRVQEKIVLLKDFLPDFLVKNRILYGIISKGIHELNEEECLNHFHILKVGIELILDEKLEKLEKQRKIDSVSQSITKIYSSITNS